MAPQKTTSREKRFDKSLLQIETEMISPKITFSIRRMLDKMTKTANDTWETTLQDGLKEMNDLSFEESIVEMGFVQKAGVLSP